MPYSPAWRAPSDLNLPEVFTTNKWGQTPKDAQFRCLTSFMCGRHPLPLRPLGQADAGLGRQYRHRRDTARSYRARDARRRAHPHERAAVRPGAGAVRQRRSARGQPVRPAEPEPVQLREQQPLGLIPTRRGISSSSGRSGVGGGIRSSSRSWLLPRRG